MFIPGQRDWAYGWFVTKISAGSPGAGSVLAEMRGDMPGNFFAWMLRYPEQDAVIIVLRNGYGSTEHLEENLQAVLFNQTPRLPSRSPKDVLAHCGLLIWNSVSQHFLLLTTFTFFALGLLLSVKRLRSKSAANLLASFPGVK